MGWFQLRALARRASALGPSSPGMARAGFNPPPSRGGAIDHAGVRPYTVCRVSIRASRRRAIDLLVAGASPLARFQSAPSREGDALAAVPPPAEPLVSIRTPLARRAMPVSSLITRRMYTSGFNPRPSRGGRCVGEAQLRAVLTGFNPRPSRGGRLTFCPAASPTSEKFQSAPSRGRAMKLTSASSTPRTRFNPRPRAEGDNRGGHPWRRMGCFNPRPRAGGRSRSVWQWGDGAEVSIRAPRAEGDTQYGVAGPRPP